MWAGWWGPPAHTRLCQREIGKLEAELKFVFTSDDHRIQITVRWVTVSHRRWQDGDGAWRIAAQDSKYCTRSSVQCDTEGLLLQKLWLCTGLSSLCFVSSDGPLTAEFCIILYTFKAFHSGHFLKAAQFKIHCRELWSEEVLEREGAARLNCWIKSCRLHTSTFSAR